LLRVFFVKCSRWDLHYSEKKELQYAAWSRKFQETSKGMNAEARLRTRKNPAISVMVVSNGPLATAGS
jgi:hypothetical protein